MHKLCAIIVTYINYNIMLDCQDILDKLKKDEMIDQNEVKKLEILLKWAVKRGFDENVFKDYQTLAELEDNGKMKLNMNEGEEDFGKIAFDLGSNNKKSSNLSNIRQAKTNASSTKGKTLSKDNNDKVVLRGRNLAFEYPPGTDPEVVVANLKANLGGRVIRSNENAYSVHKRELMCVATLKKYTIGSKVPTIRTYSYEMLKNKISSHNYDYGGECIASFLKMPSESTSSQLCEAMKEALENINVLYHSEYIISCLLTGFLTAYGIKIGWEGLEVISVDTKMEEYINDEDVKVIRCDLVLIFQAVLFIFEYKYKYNRTEDMGVKGLNCIIEKDYVNKVSRFFCLNYRKQFDKLVGFCAVGFGYTLKQNLVKCTLAWKNFEKPEVPADIKAKTELLNKKRLAAIEIRREKNKLRKRQVRMMEKEKKMAEENNK